MPRLSSLNLNDRFGSKAVIQPMSALRHKRTFRVIIPNAPPRDRLRRTASLRHSVVHSVKSFHEAQALPDFDVGRRFQLLCEFHSVQIIRAVSDLRRFDLGIVVKKIEVVFPHDIPRVARQ